MNKSKNITAIGTVRLSSESIANEKENVSKYMNYSNGCFSYLRLGKTSGAIRFYPDAQTAYKATMSDCSSLLSQGVSGSRTSLLITDSNNDTIYEGEPKMNGKILFTIYDMENVTKTVNVADFYSTTTFIQDESMNNIEEIKETTFENSANNYEEGDHADSIRHNASVFIDKNILAQESINYLCLSDTSAQKMAKLVQETAIRYKDADNETFTRAISDVSLGMITITKKYTNGQPTGENHCSIHDDRLYCAAHCKSTDHLFDGSTKWRRVPGRLNYNNLEDAILDMYKRGKEMILNVSPEYQEEAIAIETPEVIDVSVQNTSTIDTPTIKEVTTATHGCRSFNDAVQAITSTVMTYATPSEDTRFYLKMKGVSLESEKLESEIKSLTNDVMTTSITDDRIVFSILSGKSKELNISEYTDTDTLRNEVCTITMQLIASAAISTKTRDFIANVIDLDSIANYVNSQLSLPV